MLHALTAATGRVARRPLRATSLACMLPALAALQTLQVKGVPPPQGARNRHGSSYLHPRPDLRAEIALDCEGKKVTIRWSHSAIGDFAASDAAVDQAVAVSFWPTCAEVVAPNVVLVAGKERSGDTRIERWTVASPLVSQAIGSNSYSLAVQPLAEVEAVYDASAAGKDTARTMFRLRGKPSSALVQFHDSRALYELDWGNGPYALALMLTPAAEPALAADYDYSNSGDHSTAGYVYILADLETYWSVPALVFFDANRDGTIDSRQTMSFADYASARLDDRTAYRELNGVER